MLHMIWYPKCHLTPVGLTHPTHTSKRHLLQTQSAMEFQWALSKGKAFSAMTPSPWNILPTRSNNWSNPFDLPEEYQNLVWLVGLDPWGGHSLLEVVNGVRRTHPHTVYFFVLFFIYLFNLFKNKQIININIYWNCLLDSSYLGLNG